MSAPETLKPSSIGGIFVRNAAMSLVVRPRIVAVTLIICALALFCAAYAITVGRVAIPLGEVLAALLGRGAGGVHDQIIFNVRLPRVLTAIFVGAALGVSGAVFQSVSRNVLGSPDVIGFTTGAATGALLQIIVLEGDGFAVAASAVCGGLLTAAAVYLLSVRNGTTGGYRLILVGIGVGAVLLALNNLMLVRGDLDSAIAANLWLAGSLNARTWSHVVPVMVGTIVIVPLVSLAARSLSMIEMGDDIARQLGIRVERTRIWMMFCAVALAGLATGAAGPIAFVALAAPQLVLRLTGAKSLPVLSAAAMGALLLVLADLVAQMTPLDLVLPIGRMTGLVGGLYLIWLLTRTRMR